MSILSGKEIIAIATLTLTEHPDYAMYGVGRNCVLLTVHNEGSELCGHDVYPFSKAENGELLYGVETSMMAKGAGDFYAAQSGHMSVFMIAFDNGCVAKNHLCFTEEMENIRRFVSESMDGIVVIPNDPMDAIGNHPLPMKYWR